MSQLLGVTPHMLRYYEKVGIIRPETNNATGYRYYSVVDTRRFNLSRALFSSGISLERCSEILQGMPQPELGVQWKDTVTQPVGAMWRRGHNPGMPKGTEYVDLLGSAIQNQGGKIYYETTAHTLLTDDTGMEYTQMMPIADPESGDLFTGLIPLSTANYVFVNADGQRFINEGEARDTLAKAVFENGGTFYMIADLNIAEDSRWLTDWETEVERGNTIMADSLEELAEKLGFDAQQTQNFLEAIETYNGYVDAGEDPDFGKTSFAFKVEQGPFFATPRKPALHHTMGGLSIDTGAHVLDTQGNPIPGLYAAGEVTGGIHGGNRLGGNAVADCLTFGRIADTNAAAE